MQMNDESLLENYEKKLKDEYFWNVIWYIFWAVMDIILQVGKLRLNKHLQLLNIGIKLYIHWLLKNVTDIVKDVAIEESLEFIKNKE